MTHRRLRERAVVASVSSWAVTLSEALVSSFVVSADRHHVLGIGRGDLGEETISCASSKTVTTCP